jgi:hypothetical protein
MLPLAIPHPTSTWLVCALHITYHHHSILPSSQFLCASAGNRKQTTVARATVLAPVFSFVSSRSHCHSADSKAACFSLAASAFPRALQLSTPREALHPRQHAELPSAPPGLLGSYTAIRTHSPYLPCGQPHPPVTPVLHFPSPRRSHYVRHHHLDVSPSSRTTTISQLKPAPFSYLLVTPSELHPSVPTQSLQ